MLLQCKLEQKVRKDMCLDTFHARQQVLAIVILSVRLSV